LNPPLTAVEILRELVAIPTPSTVSNLPLLRWVAAMLEPRGWRVEWMPYTDEANIEKANLIARPTSFGLANSIGLAFICHTDTVPYAQNWSSALALEQREQSLHGCGACDVKGALACFLAAVSQLAPSQLSPGVALILTADEEIGCRGMDRLLAETNLRIQSAIVSEPTSLRLGIAGKGYGLARITVEGREAHSAFPQQGVSAISAAARLIVQIEEQTVAAFSISDPLFDPPHTTLNIGVIQGGTAKNIIPGQCTFLVEWRAIPSEAPASVLEKLRNIIEQAQAAEPRASFQLEALRADSGFSPASTGPLQLRLSALLSGAPMGISFGSEASRVARVADEIVVIGPGDMRTAHSDRECVPIAELELWTNVLADLIKTQ
jgi:acetylornithine deacetylase